ncbi:MAG: 5-formyltetrahydrofolate cyclo-ligase [Bacteroidota bacterium]
MDKKELRKQIKLLKHDYSDLQKKQKSDLIFSKVELHDVFKSSKCILIYWALPDEVQTQQFIQKWADKKQFILPVVNGEILDFKEYSGVENLNAGESYGILEPKGNIFENIDNIDLVIVPGIAFDRHGNRLGRGKGFYDKFLNNTKTYKLGICFDFQFFDEVPYEKHDIRMNEVIYG